MRLGTLDDLREAARNQKSCLFPTAAVTPWPAVGALLAANLTINLVLSHRTCQLGGFTSASLYAKPLRAGSPIMWMYRVAGARLLRAALIMFSCHFWSTSVAQGNLEGVEQIRNNQINLLSQIVYVCN